MRGVLGHIELAGFVITKEEWQGMDATARAQLLRAATRRDEPWVPSAPPPLRLASDDAYELYELTAVPA
jgi:hypothetical protein